MPCGCAAALWLTSLSEVNGLPYGNPSEINGAPNDGPSNSSCFSRGF